MNIVRSGDEVERVRVGDRVERAIQEHADVQHEIERGKAERPARPSLRRAAFWLGVTALSLYLVAPRLIEMFGSWRDLKSIAPAFLATMMALQLAALACLWVLQRLALYPARMLPVITSQLAGNALSKVAPGGGAVGAALQYQMLVQAGVERPRAVAGLTAANLLTFAVVLALPLLALPAIVGGAAGPDLIAATAISVLVFIVSATIGALMFALDGPLAKLGEAIQGLRNRLRRHSAPLTGLPPRLLRERDRILATLGPRWRWALLTTVGRWAFDYASLLAALWAVDSHPRPGLVLLAFCTAQVLSQVPITPGGLGFVEAGLTATLALAGVSAGDAVLAAFAYRLVSYWFVLPLGLVGVALHRRSYADG